MDHADVTVGSCQAGCTCGWLEPVSGSVSAVTAADVEAHAPVSCGLSMSTCRSVAGSGELVGLPVMCGVSVKPTATKQRQRLTFGPGMATIFLWFQATALSLNSCFFAVSTCQLQRSLIETWSEKNAGSHSDQPRRFSMFVFCTDEIASSTFIYVVEGDCCKWACRNSNVPRWYGLARWQFL
jgi:hypothetical protein